MSKNTNRKGLALGAMFSLVASLFGAAPASAAPSTEAFYIVPAGLDTTTFATLVDDDFTLLVTRNTAVVDATDVAQLKYSVTTTRTWNSTYSIHVKTSTAANTDAEDLSTLNSVGLTYSGQVLYYNGVTMTSGGTISGTVASSQPATHAYVIDPVTPAANQSNKLAFRLFDPAGDFGTWSPSVNIVVTAFLDTNGNNVFDSATEVSATATVGFQRYSAVAPSVTVTPIEDGTNFATASATISGLNLDQLPGKFAVRFTQWSGSAQVAATSYSAAAEQVITKAKASSISDTITLASPARQRNTVSAQIVYISTSATVLSGGNTDNVTTMWPRTTVTVGTTGAAVGSMYAVESANAILDSGSNYYVRPNSLVTVQASFSGVVSTSAVTATWRFTGVTLGSGKSLSVNGGTAQVANTHSAVTSTVNASTGLTSITVLPTGFALTDTLTVHVKIAGLPEMSVTLDAIENTYSLERDASIVATAPATAVAIGASVEDRWGEVPSMTDLRVSFTWTAGYSGTATISNVSVVAGRVSAMMTPSRVPATTSTNAVVTLQVQYNNDGAWTNIGSSTTVDVVVTDAANRFRTGLAKSYSASISYGADFTWSALISDAYVLVTGSSVVVSGTGLIFKDAVNGATASDRLTLPADSAGQVKFYVTGRKAGEYTVTLTAGSATTTSLVVIGDALDNTGKTMTFDISSMESGRAAIVTGTLTDLNGNPVDTPADRIALTVTGTGATYVGSLTTQTDANGRFQVALLSGTNQTGTITITAVYSPTAAAAAADRITKVHSVSVVAPTAPEVNAVIGSFSGRWAVRVENAKGSVVSVKAGNRWVKFSALNNNYLFSRKSVVGRTIAVSVWVDGELQNSQTITIK